MWMGNRFHGESHILRNDCEPIIIRDFSESFSTFGVNIHKQIIVVTPHWSFSDLAAVDRCGTISRVERTGFQILSHYGRQGSNGGE